MKNGESMPLGPPLNLRARAHRSEVDAMQIRVKKHQVVTRAGAYVLSWLDCVHVVTLFCHLMIEIHGIVSTVEENAR